MPRSTRDRRRRPRDDSEEDIDEVWRADDEASMAAPATAGPLSTTSSCGRGPPSADAHPVTKIRGRPGTSRPRIPQVDVDWALIERSGGAPSAGWATRLAAASRAGRAGTRPHGETQKPVLDDLAVTADAVSNDDCHASTRWSPSS